MIKKFYQEVKDINGATIKVIDFEKLRAEGHSFNVIMSEREKVGKTTSALQMVKNRWDNNKEKSIYILNSEDMIARFKNKLIAANKLIYPKQWENVKLKGSGLEENGEVFCYFVSISAPHKFKVGGRDPKITTIIYDEFNEGLTHIRNKQVKNFETIVLSCNQANAFKGAKYFIQAFIFANQETINVPLLLNYRITSINQELQTYHYDNEFSVLVYVPKLTKAQRERINKTKNWMVGMTKVSGSAEINIFNSANWDNTSGVIPVENQLDILRKATTENEYIKFKPNYFAKVWYFRNEQQIEQIYLEYKTKAFNPYGVYVFNRKDKYDLDNIYNPEIKDLFYSYYINKVIWFSNYPLKEEFHGDILGKRAR